MSRDKHRCRDLKVDPRYRTMLEKRGGKKKEKEIEEKGWIDVSKLSRTTIDALRCLSYLIIPRSTSFYAQSSFIDTFHLIPLLPFHQ